MPRFREALARIEQRLAAFGAAADRPAPVPVAGIPALDAALREVPPYSPTHDFAGPLINARHAAIAAAPETGALIDLGIQGFLRKADALKLYEMAYFAAGPVIEFGAGWGLSTTVLCEGVRDGGGSGRVTSLECDRPRAGAAARAVAARGLAPWLDLAIADAGRESKRLLRAGRSFTFAFVDHDHGFVATRAICTLLRRLLTPGGFVLFHDFNDPRNLTEFPGFGVYRGVTETLAEADFAFRGLFGCSALFERRAASLS